MKYHISLDNIPKILIVDDDEPTCHLLSEALSNMKCEVLSTTSAINALEIAEDWPPDIALVDINMPEMDGFTLVNRLRFIHKDVGVILVSGYGNFKNALKAIKVGAEDFLEKPVKLDELTFSVGQTLEKIRLRQEIREKTELLRQSEEKYRILVENTADGVALFHRGKIVFQNRSFARLLGLDSMTMKKKDLADLLHPEDRHKAISDITRVLKGDSVGPVRYRFRKCDGSYCWMSVNSACVSYKGRKTILSTFRDITPLVEMENIRKDMERMLRHDMKSHLVGIVGLAERLVSKTILDSTQDKYCRQIVRSGKQLQKMVDTYLDISRMEDGSFKPQMDSFNLLDIVVQARRVLRSLADAKNIDIVIIFNHNIYSTEHNLPFIGDKIYLQNALNNLFKNAIEASPENRSVKIKVSTDPDYVKISIHNWGVVPEKVRHCFFKKYTTCGKENGTGLGTYMAHLAVTSHGGRIYFKSSKDAGTTVTMEFPADKCLPSQITAG